MLRAIIAQQGKERGHILNIKYSAGTRGCMIKSERAKLKGKRLKDKGQRKEAAQSSKLKAER